MFTLGAIYDVRDVPWATVPYGDVELPSLNEF
jgi:hypothetical protein